MYSNLYLGEPTYLTQEQIDLLTSHDFPWPTKEEIEAYGARERFSYNEIWERNYVALVAYKEKHGHAKVPMHHPRLGNWVHFQRSAYAKLIKGKRSSLTEERLDKLIKVGFSFSAKELRGKRGHNSERYDSDINASSDDDDNNEDEEVLENNGSIFHDDEAMVIDNIENRDNSHAQNYDQQLSYFFQHAFS